MHRRKLSVWFFAWLLLVSGSLGLALGFAAAHGAGAWTTYGARHEREDFAEYLKRSEERQVQRTAFERKLAFLTVPLGFAFVAVLFGRLALRRTVISVTNDAVHIAGIIGTRSRARSEVARVTKSSVFRLVAAEPIYVVEFHDGRRAFIRPLFVSNAADLAQALASSIENTSNA